MPHRPGHVQWLITRRCNYRCIGCNVWREEDSRELSTDQIMKGLDILRDLGVMEIVFSGGAPLIRDDISEILEYASRYFITTVYDNGSLAVGKIDALRNVDFVAISLDTMDPEKNDRSKGIKGSWTTAMKAIDALKREGITVGVSPTISQTNLYEITDLTKYSVERGIPIWYCLYSYDTQIESDQLFKIGKRNDEQEIIDKEYMVKLCDSLIAMKRQNSNILVTTKLLRTVKNLYMLGERAWKCRALRSFFMIDHLGRVAGCHLRSPVTSIFALPNVWRSPRLENLRRTYSKCKQCTYLCYIFYSLHGGVIGNFQVAQDRWRNAKLFLKKGGNTPLVLAGS